MSSSNFDVIVVGAGAAGLTAAIGLARAGFTVAVVEAAAFPGAENWSGCVYFCENLAHPDILGPEGVEALAWERRLVERGFFATDGYSILGLTYRDPEAFRHCYTVLRPIYDHHLAQVALRLGVALLTSTTAETLVRADGKIVGITTNRGPLFADLVFLAEGDASHLVTREGYERLTEPRQKPTFLQGIKLVLELPPGAIEERFGVQEEEGVAYEMLLRNGSLRGKPVHLNAGGFIYTNRRSLSIGLVLPADHLHQQFEGDPNLLLEWFENLPALQPWLRGGQRGVFGAKIIRGGGAREIPQLIDDGLAIGGAASGVGVDFPYPNFTGPATAMGLLLVQAARQIRAAGATFTKENLERHYLRPLQQHHYWQDVEFLRSWPGYVKKTQVFFGRQIDFTLQSAYTWTRSNQSVLRRWHNWLHVLLHYAGPRHWGQWREDAAPLSEALRLHEVLPRLSWPQLIFEGAINAARDLFGSPRAHVPEHGEIRLYYNVGGGSEPAGLPPTALRRWFRRLAPVLAAAAGILYRNDDTPLSQKLPAAARLLVRQINLFDLLAAGSLTLAASVSGAVMTSWRRLTRKNNGDNSIQQLPQTYLQAVERAGDLTRLLAPAGQSWEARLAQLQYDTVKASHIHVFWPTDLARKDAIAQAGLFHVCPAHVYEARGTGTGQLQVVVNFENCIKCETCWRTSDLVDWGRDGAHRFVYAVHSPVLPKLLADLDVAGPARPALPRASDPWSEDLAALRERLRTEPVQLSPEQSRDVARFAGMLRRLERKLQEYDEALAEEPRTVNVDRGDYLAQLTRYAQQMALDLYILWQDSTLAQLEGVGSELYRRIEKLAFEIGFDTESRHDRAASNRLTWAAAEGRRIRQCYLAPIGRYLELLRSNDPDHFAPREERGTPWLAAERRTAISQQFLADCRTPFDAVFPPTLWRDLEQQLPLSAEQDQALRQLLAQIPPLDPQRQAETLHPPERAALLAELAQRDPSLAFRAAHHLWARDLATVARLPDAERWQRAEEWACLVLPPAEGSAALFVPAGKARSLLVLRGNQVQVCPLDDQQREEGVQIEPLETLGLRGAGLTRVTITAAAGSRVPVDGAALYRTWQILGSADLTAIALGMSELLCRRAIEHATGRVQFPGLFHDEEARDSIGKFGAVKKMIADMAARKYVMETLLYGLTPTAVDETTAQRLVLVKALVAEALGTAPGSVSYNAGQVFGGTGYSEDDVLSKFYRDAAAWRFLGHGNVQVFLEHGRTLLQRWNDGDPLSTLPQEAELFDEVAQRKALLPCLDHLRHQRARLRALVQRWQGAVAPLVEEPGRAEFCEQLGRADAHLLASKTVLLRTHARLEEGYPSATEIALLRVWLDAAEMQLGAFEAAVERQVAGGVPPGAPTQTPPGAPATRYADYLAAPVAADSGDFLCQPLDPLQARYVPEMVETDPDLAAKHRELVERLTAHFGRLRDGLVYERYVEKRHRPDTTDLDFLRQQGYFRFPIPRELDGEAASKAHYYLLTNNVHRLADVSVSLTIQVNSSLGTTPVLLARDKDLPKALKEVAGFAADTALHKEVGETLQNLTLLASRGDARALKDGMTALGEKLKGTVLGKAAVRVLADRFVTAWQQAVSPGQQYNFAALQATLEEARQHWAEACGYTAEYQGELQRRREACDLFLRWVASGQISAFALTEPSAGSDTARVATRARLRSVPVEVEPDGVMSFVPVGGKERRYLLDARKLEFRESVSDNAREVRACYRWSDSAEPSPIMFDEYDYETDDPSGLRWYDHGGRQVRFTDIAQLREREGRLWYDYWELTGAKMWITNGRMCGIMCLYAKTDQGVTGFMVDRHAEGLVVGKDEAKMGQLGSPTNELSLQAVRVPRENVIGLEGRGQVNALETLNVGRAGLAMSAMCQMPRLIEWCRTFSSPLSPPAACVAWRLQQMEELCFISEALAYETIGRFEHKQTKSVRLESAIAKMLVSELLHQVIETAEEVHGLAGQTREHLVEKRKRDARVLNIYEGTNEIQRFFILRDLVSEVASRWSKGSPVTLAPGENPELRHLEHLRLRVQERTRTALDLLGQQLSHNPNLQASCFVLAEAVAWLAAAGSTLARLVWLERQSAATGEATFQQRARLGRQAYYRCALEVRERLQRFDLELSRLKVGQYNPAIRAAMLLFRAPEPATLPWPANRITRPLSILVVLEPPLPAVPQPAVVEGKLQEAYRTFSAGDRAALETALRLRDSAPQLCSVQVVAVGPASTAQPLREVLSLGIERVRLITTPNNEAVALDRAAQAITALLENEPLPDLILGGAGTGQAEEGLLASLVATALQVPLAGEAAALAVDTAGEGQVLVVGQDQSRRTRVLPACVLSDRGLSLRSFTISGYLRGLEHAVQLLSWPVEVPHDPVAFILREKTVARRDGLAERPHPLLPREASLMVRQMLGLGSGATGDSKSLEQEWSIEEVNQPLPVLPQPGSPGDSTPMVLALLGVDGKGRLRGAAERVIQAALVVADTLEARTRVLVLVLAPRDEMEQQEVAGRLATSGAEKIILVPIDTSYPDEVKNRLLVESVRQMGGGLRALVGEPWTEPALAALFSSVRGEVGNRRLFVRVLELDRRQGQLVLDTARVGGKVHCQQVLAPEPNAIWWLGLAEEAEVAGVPASRSTSTRLLRWLPALTDFYGRDDIQRLLAEVKQAAGLVRLSDAEFIIDVGFGVGNRDGYEAVIEPLEKTLRSLGVTSLMIGGSRKVTEELHLLPADRQIGQSGVSVRPRLLLAIGISGAPQHLNYIAARTTIIAFNRDPEAPIMTLNQRQAQPQVYPVIGDLFETVPAFTTGLLSEQPLQPQRYGREITAGV